MGVSIDKSWENAMAKARAAMYHIKEEHPETHIAILQSLNNEKYKTGLLFIDEHSGAARFKQFTYSRMSYRDKDIKGAKISPFIITSDELDTHSDIGLLDNQGNILLKTIYRGVGKITEQVYYGMLSSGSFA